MTFQHIIFSCYLTQEYIMIQGIQDEKPVNKKSTFQGCKRRIVMKGKSAMKKFIFAALLLTLTVVCFYPAMSYADAPKDVKIDYNQSTQALTVTITHKSMFGGMHYIKSVEIRKNSVPISVNNYDSQPKEVPFTYTYKVAAAEGDILEANVICSMSGSKSASVTVGKAKN